MGGQGEGGRGQGGSGGADPRGLGQGIRKKVNCKSVNLTLKTSVPAQSGLCRVQVSRPIHFS